MSVDTACPSLAKPWLISDFDIWTPCPCLISGSTTQQNLETLDLKETGVSELPVEILKLHRLRHLLVYRSTYKGYNRHGVSVSTGGGRRIGNLTCLQKLSYLDFRHQTTSDRGGVLLLKELGKLTQLRRLGIVNLKTKDGRDLCLALEKMKHLDSLEIGRSPTTITDVNKEEEDEFLELESLVSPPQFLRRLYLHGRLRRLPVWIANNSLRNLTALSLRYSRLSDDPLKAFQHLSNLVYLCLLGAYDGEELCCSEVGGYKNLQRLFLFKMERLKRVRFIKRSMPMLRELHIGFCPEMEKFPLGFEYLRECAVFRS